MIPSKTKNLRQSGSTLIYSAVVIFIFSMVLIGILSSAVAQLRVVKSSINREMAFQIAEAGANYYQWRLAHYAQDFWDGNASTTPGPYIHDYIDKDTNQKIGEFSLEITPPVTGSTITTIKSTGYTLESPSTKRTITVRYGIPSLAKYAFLTNNDVWVGDTESVNGEFHANGGIHFDGTGNAPIKSAKKNIPPGPGYQCYSYHGCLSPFEWKPGVWGSAATTTKNYWQMAVPNVDFTSITSDFSNLENIATGQADLPPAGAGFQGYSLVFNINGTVSVYKVSSLRQHGSGTDVNGVVHAEDLDYNSRTLQYTMPIPTSGVIFVKDHVWVEGVVNGRVVVAATKYSTDPAQQARILIPASITYLAKDGNHVLGLIAEKDVLITYFAPNSLEIDAAVIAQKGSAQIYNFSSVKNTLTIYGTIASFGVWTWGWVNGAGGCTSGYCNTITTYDANLLYAPPPSFPLSADGYQQISWSSD